ncbi:MAG: cysteine desulfurase [Candidatus Bathyarchaeia archaeon]|jgi:cysteine desulfurase/selenocysteine lyase
MTLNVTKIRKDFPILKRRISGKPLVYLDNAATSQKPKAVIAAIDRYYQEYNANVHRGVHRLSEEATIAFEQSREKFARFIGAKTSKEIVFVRNATEALNLVALTWARANLRSGDRILLTEMEHHSNIVPWQMLAKEKGLRIEYVEIRDDGTLNWENFEQLIKERPKVLSLAHVSNALGTINPVRQMAREAHEMGATVIVDAAQSVPHMPVNVADLECDFLAASGHKMLAPTGIGMLYGRQDLLEHTEPLMGGGEMIKEVHLQEARWNDLPWKFEAGTPNIEGVIGLGAAVDYLTELGMQNVREHEKNITRYAIERLANVKSLALYGTREIEKRGAVISFNLGDIHAHDLATILDTQGIAIRSGQHCAEPLMERLKVPATSRASFYIYNTRREVDILVRALEKAGKMFKI